MFCSVSVWHQPTFLVLRLSEANLPLRKDYLGCLRCRSSSVHHAANTQPVNAAPVVQELEPGNVIAHIGTRSFTFVAPHTACLDTPVLAHVPAIVIV
jgi:hypothetical protein